MKCIIFSYKIYLISENELVWKKYVLEEKINLCLPLEGILNGRFVELFHSSYDGIIVLWNHGNT